MGSQYEIELIESTYDNLATAQQVFAMRWHPKAIGII
jgi:hypothetical protein